MSVSSRSPVILPLSPCVPFLPHLQRPKSTAVNDFGPKGALELEAIPELGGQGQSGRGRLGFLATAMAGREPVSLGEP